MIEGRWMPQTEEEWELLEDLHAVTRHAHNENVSRQRIASLLAFMASAAANASALEEMPQRPAESRDEPEREEAMTEEETCPECGGEIEEVMVGFGLNPTTAIPCRHDLSEHYKREELRTLVNEINGDSL